MSEQHPITPPPELRQLWAQQAHRVDPRDPVAWLEHVANQAARWGADQQLEHCADWLDGYERDGWAAKQMRNDLRPKPPSLAEEAAKQLAQMEQHGALDCNVATIRAALERLQELEKGNE